MSQADTMTPNKFSFVPGRLTRYFLLLIIVLLVTMGVLVQSAVNTWLKDKSYQVIGMTHNLHKRIDTWRHATWQIYDTLATTPVSSNMEGLQETRIKQGVYYLEKPRRKTESLIFGEHDSCTLEITQRMSNYLDTLWGAETVPWSMYYLNGLDNSLILVSTLPLKDLASGFKESVVSKVVDARRVDILKQANKLDERESLSLLRPLTWQNGYYFTLRTTFNQPGNLATVVAFDLPINDLIPPNMPLDSFRLDYNVNPSLINGIEKIDTDNVNITFNRFYIEISSPINSTNLHLVWKIPLGTLLLDTLQDILPPLLLNIGLIVLAIFGYTTFRYQDMRQDELPSSAINQGELHLLCALNDELASLLPVGLLVHDQETNRSVISNKIADHLLPHLNLQNIAAMADQHHGVIQATINNELYEIRQFRSQILPRTQIFIIQDQDREILLARKLKQAQRLYEKNQQGRDAFLHHIGKALKQPIALLSEQIDTLNISEKDQLLQQADAITQRVNEIQLLTMLEDNSWKSTAISFAIQDLIDEIVPLVLPMIKRKGLQFFINNHLSPDEERHGDRDAFRHILLMLIQYSVTTTHIGKITLDITADESGNDRITFRLLDTGNGISHDEIDNIHFPFLNKTSADRYGDANGLAFYLCNQLAHRFNGYLNIKTRNELGTRYTLNVKMAAKIQENKHEERLLDGVIALIDITSNDVRHIVVRQLEYWGATCTTPDERSATRSYDLFLTDNSSKLTASGILLSDNETGIHRIGPGQLCVNFNISHAMQEAILQMIEEQLAQEETFEMSLGGDENTQLHTSGYHTLFVDTVPDDVRKLYTELEMNDFAALAQTAHRLKGAFAMLNLITGKHLCETLEHHIQENDAPSTEKYINDIDLYVKRLM